MNGATRSVCPETSNAATPPTQARPAERRQKSRGPENRRPDRREALGSATCPHRDWNARCEKSPEAGAKDRSVRRAESECNLRPIVVAEAESFRSSKRLAPREGKHFALVGMHRVHGQRHPQLRTRLPGSSS